MRPHAELIKKWADDPTMEIEFLAVGDEWEVIPNPTFHPSLLYREKTKEKKKVEMWQWAVRRESKPEMIVASQFYATTDFIVASQFYATTDFLRQDYPPNNWKIICKIEGSKIEVEE